MRSLISLSLLLAVFSLVQADVVLTQPPSLTGKPGHPLRLTCKTSGFDLSSYRMHWVRQVPGKGLEWLLHYYSPTSSYNAFAPGIEDRVTVIKENSKNIFDLIIKSPRVDDTAIYYCARGDWGFGSRYLDYWGQGTMMTVTNAETTPPSLYALLPYCGQSSSGGSVTVGCLASSYSPDPAIFTWTSNEQLITDQVTTYTSVLNKNGLYTLSSQLTIAESQLGSINCKVAHKSNTWSAVRGPMPDLPSPLPPVVILTQFSPEDIVMRKPTTAICFIYGFRPDSLSVEWLKDWQPIHSGVVTSPSVENNGTFSTSSRLTVTAREWKSDSVYTCKVTHQPTHTITVKNITKYPDCDPPEPVKVSFLPPSPKQVLMEPIVTLTCVVANAPHDVSVTWTQEQTHLQSGYGKPSATWPQEVISKLNISTQDWTGGKVYFCIVSHDDIPTPIRKKIFKETEYRKQPSVYLLLPSAEELSAQQSLTLSCLVKNFAPKEIFVEWTVNDQSIHADKYKNTEVMADSADGDYSMYSMLSISAGDWDRGYSYSCVVGHETFPLKTLTRAVNKSSGKPSFVNISLVLMDTVNACE
nr:secretory form of immunoglobulin heavy chain [Callorhinchus milii]